MKIKYSRRTESCSDEYIEFLSVVLERESGRSARLDAARDFLQITERVRLRRSGDLNGRRTRPLRQSENLRLRFVEIRLKIVSGALAFGVRFCYSVLRRVLRRDDESESLFSFFEVIEEKFFRGCGVRNKLQ